MGDALKGEHFEQNNAYLCAASAELCARRCGVGYDTGRFHITLGASARVFPARLDRPCFSGRLRPPSRRKTLER